MRNTAIAEGSSDHKVTPVFVIYQEWGLSVFDFGPINYVPFCCAYRTSFPKLIKKDRKKPREIPAQIRATRIRYLGKIKSL